MTCFSLSILWASSGRPWMEAAAMHFSSRLASLRGLVLLSTSVYAVLVPVPEVWVTHLLSTHRSELGMGISEGSEDSPGESFVSWKEDSVTSPTPLGSCWYEFQCSENKVHFSSLLVSVFISDASEPQELLISLDRLSKSKLRWNLKLKAATESIKSSSLLQSGLVVNLWEQEKYS